VPTNGGHACLRPAGFGALSPPYGMTAWKYRTNGNSRRPTSVVCSEKGCEEEEKESVMPMIFFLWAIPAVIVIGRGTYWLMHVH
jgi:hypothetical protein